MAPLLEARGLVVGRNRPLWPALDLVVSEGECIGVLGVNGVGKSTLAATLAGVLSPLAGDLHLAGRPWDGWSARERARHVAFVPQVPPPDMGFRVREYIALGRHPHMEWPGFLGDADDDRIVGVIAEMGLGDVAMARLDRLSGGERQRVRLAQALVQEAGLLVLDEPTTWLDPGAQIDLARVLQRWKRGPGRALIIVLHDINLASLLSDRLLWMGRAGIESQGPVADVITDGFLASVYGANFRLCRDAASGRTFVIPSLEPTGSSWDGA